MRSSKKILTDIVTALRHAATPAEWSAIREEAIQWQRGQAGESDCCTECGREQLVKHMECPKDDPANMICGTCHARHIKDKAQQ